MGGIKPVWRESRILLNCPNQESLFVYPEMVRKPPPLEKGD